MSNTPAVAAKWAEFMASRPEFPANEKLRAALRAGKITRLCPCGCNSFDLEVSEGAGVPPLTKPGSSRAIFQIYFRTPEELRSVEFTVFVDKRGHLCGIDVDYCANAFPMPEDPDLVEPPFHVRAFNELDA